jgi:hypothetical protein
MQNVVDHWLAFNSWSTELPVYLQVFLGMSLFFVSASGLVAAIYYIIKLMLRLSAMPVLSHLVGLLGYLLMLMLGWLAYVALPLVFFALSGQQEITLSLIAQAVSLYFMAFILLTIVVMDFMDSRKLWHTEDYTLSTLAKLFNASVWVLAMGYPVLHRWRQAR